MDQQRTGHYQTIEPRSLRGNPNNQVGVIVNWIENRRSRYVSPGKHTEMLDAVFHPLWRPEVSLMDKALR